MTRVCLLLIAMVLTGAWLGAQSLRVELGASQRVVVQSLLREFPVPFVVKLDGSPHTRALTETRLKWRRLGETGWRTVTRKLKPGLAQNSAAFVPIYGEGAYEVKIAVTDRDGRVGQWQGEPLLIRFDLTAPIITLRLTAAGKAQYRVEWSAADVSLTAEQINFEYSTGADAAWQPWRVLEPQDAKTISESTGALQGGFSFTASSGPYIRVRMSATDLAGRSSRLVSGRTQSGPRPQYRVSRPVETLSDQLTGLRYVGAHYSRRARFDLLIKEVTPWEIPATGLTLYSRRVGQRGWRAHTVSGRHWRRVGFLAPVSGVYQFIAVARNSRNQTDQTVIQGGDGGGPQFADSEIELEIWVDVTHFSCRVAAFPPRGTKPHAEMAARGINLPAESRAVAGESYQLEFELSHGLRAAQLEIEIELSLDGGRKWRRARGAGLGPLKYRREPLPSGSADIYAQRVRYRTGITLPDQVSSAAILRVTARDSGDLTPLQTSAMTPVFSISRRLEPESPQVVRKGIKGAFFRAKLKAGDDAVAIGDDTEAVRHWRDAQTALGSAIRPELERRLEAAHRRLGNSRAARLHRRRLKASTVPDRQ